MTCVCSDHCAGIQGGTGCTSQKPAGVARTPAPVLRPALRIVRAERGDAHRDYGDEDNGRGGA